MDDRNINEPRKRISTIFFPLKHPLKTSSEIINEAKAFIRYQPSTTNNNSSTSSNISSSSSNISNGAVAMNAKVVKTKRPYTPLDKHRILFGTTGQRERPPSCINLHTIQFQEPPESSSKLHKNNSIEELPKIGTKVKLPSISHKSMTSLEKVEKGAPSKPVLADQREIHSSPEETSKTKIDVEFPRVTKSTSGSLKLLPIGGSSSSNSIGATVNEEKMPKRKIMNAWVENNNNIVVETKIAEKSKRKSTTPGYASSILTMITKAISEGYEYEEMISYLEKLYDAVEADGLTKNGQRNNSIRNSILKVMFGMIESADDTLILYIVQIILILKVTGPNLESVCKVIFKVSRNDKNDNLFEERGIIALFVDCLGLATPEEDTIALIYGYGALKFLTINAQLLNQARNHGILQLMTLHLKMVNLARSEKPKISNHTNHMLFQLTGCLRNIAGDERTHNDFSDNGILSALSNTLWLFADDQDLVINIARTLSVLSVNDKCCQIMASVENLNILIRILSKYYEKDDIIIRLLYALGNVLATCEQSRLRFYKRTDSSVCTLRDIMKCYMQKDLECASNPLSKTNCRSVDDVLIKLISVIANMSIDPKVGIGLMCTSYNNDGKLRNHKEADDLLDMLITLLRRKSVQENEELILSALSTLNNLSYYSHPHVKGPLQQRYLDITEALNSFLSTKNVNCMVEIARVYANLTHSIAITEYILETGGFSCIIKWLDSKNTELLCTTSGVLVNMMVDQNACKIFKHTNGITKLIRILETQAENDWLLATLVCQVIWNYSAHMMDTFYTLESETGQILARVLIDLLDEDKLFGGKHEEAVNSGRYKQWENFSTVATNILEKAESSV